MCVSRSCGSAKFVAVILFLSVSLLYMRDRQIFVFVGSGHKVPTSIEREPPSVKSLEREQVPEPVCPFSPSNLSTNVRIKNFGGRFPLVNTAASISPEQRWWRSVLLTHAEKVLSWRFGSTLLGQNALPVPKRASLLALVGAHTPPTAAGAAARVRMRATWTAMQSPSDFVLVFVIAVHSLPDDVLISLAIEAQHEGDLLLLSGVQDGVSTKTLAHLGIAWALSGDVFRFLMKIDSDSFVLPQPYAAMLRALPKISTYGGNEYTRNHYHWNSVVDYMAGGGYFISPDIGEIVHEKCSSCWTDAISSLDLSKRPRHCMKCVHPDEDMLVGHFVKDIHQSGRLGNISYVRVNEFHGTGNRGLDGYLCLNACLTAELSGSSTCKLPPLLLLHAIKTDALWWRITAHFWLNFYADGKNGDVLVKPFQNFSPPPVFWPFDYMVELSPALNELLFVKIPESNSFA